MVKPPQQDWLHLLIGLIVILTANLLVIGGIIFSIHLLLLPWLIAYTVGMVEHCKRYYGLDMAIAMHIYCGNLKITRKGHIYVRNGNYPISKQI